MAKASRSTRGRDAGTRLDRAPESGDSTGLGLGEAAAAGLGADVAVGVEPGLAFATTTWDGTTSTVGGVHHARRRRLPAAAATVRRSARGEGKPMASVHTANRGGRDTVEHSIHECPDRKQVRIMTPHRAPRPKPKVPEKLPRGPYQERPMSDTVPSADTRRPVVRSSSQRDIVPAQQTPGIRRRQAFAGGDRWVGYVETQPGEWSGWHHHGETDTYMCVVAGVLEFEFGPARERLSVAPGEFALMPAGVVHRERTAPGGPGEIVLVRLGPGPAVVNMDGPQEPA